ncbi:MAG: hypothetical protein ABI405_12420 [Parafilimonas sp.]
MVFQLNDEQIKDLLQDAFKKIESKATQDSKLFSDMNNALNWILSLTTVMFVLYIRLSVSNITGLNQGIYILAEFCSPCSSLFSSCIK